MIFVHKALRLARAGVGAEPTQLSRFARNRFRLGCKIAPEKIDQLTRWSFFFVKTEGSEELFLIFTEGSVPSSSLGGVTKNENRLIRWFFVTPKKKA